MSGDKKEGETPGQNLKEISKDEPQDNSEEWPAEKAETNRKGRVLDKQPDA